MAKIYRKTERKKIKFDDVTISFAALSNIEKSQLAAEAGSLTNAGEMLDLSYKTLKKCVKHVEGVEYGDGESFQLKFDKGGEMTNECLEELLTLSVSNEMLAVSQTLIHQFGANEFIDSATKEPIPGVSVLGNEPKAGKKKKK